MMFISVICLLLVICRSTHCILGNQSISELSFKTHFSGKDVSEQDLSAQLEDIDRFTGKWSVWSDWSACSRSCDGGSSYQLRTCLSGVCRGEHVRYKICNMQACPDSHDFREDQCSTFNSYPYEGTLYEWTPQYEDDEPCILSCKGKPVGGKTEDRFIVIAKLAEKVHDGTRCRPGSLDMCIDGVCRRVGCDLQVDSLKQVDECGVCGGDGSSCARPLYHWALAFTSMCSASCGGGYRRSRPVCQNRVTGEEVEEELCNDSQKPDTTLVECNVHNCPPSWQGVGWGSCSASCGEGTRVRQVYCIEEANDTKIRVADVKCGSHKPWLEETCNQVDCPKWQATEWSPCSVTCGDGFQFRSVECKDSTGHSATSCLEETKPIDSRPCLTNVVCDSTEDSDVDISSELYEIEPLSSYPDPPSPQRLIGDQQVPSESTFIPSEWGPCSVSCGEGIRAREVHCKIFLEFSKTIAKLPDRQCSGPKPAEIEKCVLEPCTAQRVSINIKDDPYGQRTDIRVAPGSPGKSYSWKEQGYTHCSATCLGGIQELIIHCVRDDTQKVTSPFMCPIELKPEIRVQTCNDHPCPPRWNFSEFSPCSHSCGIGIQTREVNCVHEVTQGGGNTLVVPHNMCPQPPPPDRQYCNVLDCPVKWELSSWSKCSKTCGGGEKTRKVECKQVMAQNHVVDRPPTMCPSQRPIDKKPCNTKSCIVESDKPTIDVSNSTFIQHDSKKNKITLKVGGAATIFVGSTIKIKCPVKRFNRTKIIWKKDNDFLQKLRKYKVSKKGALRISNLGLRDTGQYTCIAGQSSANIYISVRNIPGEFPNSEEIQKGISKSQKVYFKTDIPRSDGSPIFTDDQSHEQRPDGAKKKPTSKTRLFTPTSPSLRLDPNIVNGQSRGTSKTPNKNQDPQFLPSSSSELNVVLVSTSSANRVVPNFQQTILNLQQMERGSTFSDEDDEHIEHSVGDFQGNVEKREISFPKKGIT